MHTPAAIQKILVDFGVCVDDQSALDIISSPLDNDETITINCSIGDIFACTVMMISNGARLVRVSLGTAALSRMKTVRLPIVC